MYVAFRSVETDWVNMLVSNTTALILLKAYLHRFGVKDSIILAQTLAMCLGGLAVLCEWRWSVASTAQRGAASYPPADPR